MTPRDAAAWLVVAALGLTAGCRGYILAPTASGRSANAGDARAGGTSDAAETPPGPFELGAVGPACERDDDCSAPGAVCRADPAAPAEDLAPMALGCGRANPQLAGFGDACATNDDCDRGLCAFAGTCVRPCVADDDCGAGRFCTQVYTRTGAAAMQPFQACVARLDLPPGVTASPRQRQAVLTPEGDLAPIQLAGITEPARASLTLVEVERGDIPRLDLLSTHDGDATVLFSLPAVFQANARAPLNPVTAASAAFGILIPNSPGSIVTLDGYDLEMQLRSETEVALTTLTRAERGSVLDVNLFYVGVPGLVPTGDRGPARITAALASLEETYRAAGITVGEVRQFQLVGGLATQLASIDPVPDGEITEEETLFKLSAGAGRPCVNFFFVRALGMSLGRAGGIPGTQAAHGTGGSGIVLLYNLPTGETLGDVMSHELGHYLGLFHTSEFDGAVLDPLPDTRECRASQDVNGDGFVAPSECAGNGGDNLMFWAGSSQATPVVTPQQREVVTRAMVLR